jgi:hypothetical protein
MFHPRPASPPAILCREHHRRPGRSSRKYSSDSTLGHGTSTSCIFYDQTLGDMDTDCLPLNGVSYNCYMADGFLGVLSTSNNSYQPAYGTTTGWDFATGIGTVNAYNLVVNWPTSGHHVGK